MVLTRDRIYSAIASGVGAGILGINGMLHGFVFFVTGWLVCSIAIYIRTSRKPFRYVESLTSFMLFTIFDELCSFILFWTL